MLSCSCLTDWLLSLTPILSTPRMIVFLEQVAYKGLHVKTVMIGEGLFDHNEMIDEYLKSKGHQVFVYQADSTAASEDAGLPPRFSAEGMKAR